MTGRERIRKAINGEPVDHVPVSFYTHLFDETDNSVGINVRWLKNTGMDMLCVGPDGYYQLQTERPLCTISDWKEFRPYSPQHPYIADQAARVKGILDAVQGDSAIYYWVFTPFSLLKHTLGGETAVMELWNEDRDGVLEILDILEETNYVYMDELYKTGLDGLGLSFQQGEYWRFTQEDYIRYLRPYDLRFIEFANRRSENNFGHLCSWAADDDNASVNLSLWKDYDFKALNWGVYQPRTFTMKEGRQFFEKAKCVMGGFDRRSEGVLYSGSEKEIRDFTASLIAETGTTGFIISADCSIRPDTPVENIRYVVEASASFSGNAE